MFSFYCTQVLLQLVLDVTHKCLHNNMTPGNQLASCSTKTLYISISQMLNLFLFVFFGGGDKCKQSVYLYFQSFIFSSCVVIMSLVLM